jgi:hypothetical protein
MMMTISQLDLAARLAALERVTSLILPTALPINFDVDSWSESAKNDFAAVEPSEFRDAVEERLQEWVQVMHAFRPGGG